MFYQNFGENHGDPYYEPTIMIHDSCCLRPYENVDLLILLLACSLVVEGKKIDHIHRGTKLNLVS